MANPSNSTSSPKKKSGGGGEGDKPSKSSDDVKKKLEESIEMLKKELETEQKAKDTIEWSNVELVREKKSIYVYNFIHVVHLSESRNFNALIVINTFFLKKRLIKFRQNRPNPENWPNPDFPRISLVPHFSPSGLNSGNGRPSEIRLNDEIKLIGI